MKQAYKKVYNTHGLYDFVPVELTGKCKNVSGGPWWSDNFSSELNYVQVQRRVFGIPLGKYWVEKKSIRICDPITEVVYDCDLLNDDCCNTRKKL